LKPVYFRKLRISLKSILIFWNAMRYERRLIDYHNGTEAASSAKRF